MLVIFKKRFIYKSHTASVQNLEQKRKGIKNCCGGGGGGEKEEGFEKGGKMRSTKKLSLDDYVDFCRNPHEHRLIYNHINQVISMHGFVKVQKALKTELLEQLRSIDVMVPQRSTLKENISSSAILTLTEVKEDLASLEWNECPIQSILAVGSGKETQLIEGDELLHTNQASSSSTCIAVVVGGGGKGEKLKRKRKRISLSELGTKSTAPATTLPLLTSAEITPPSSSLSLGCGNFFS